MPKAPRPSLLRESGTGAAGSAIALAAGLGLDLSMALFLGAGPDTDALFVALRIPLGIGVFFPPTAIQVLVPAMTGWTDRGRDTLNSRTTAVAVATLLITGLIASIGAFGAPVLVRLQAPGLGEATHRLATDLARVAFLLIPLVATAQVFRAYRYAQHRQGIASALQGVLGVTVLGFVMVLGRRVDVAAVVMGYVAGGVLLLLLAWMTARAGGYQVTTAWGLSNETRRLGRRSLAPLAASGLQLAIRLFEQFVASFFAPGSITILTYANRLVSAVGGTLFFRPIVTVFLGRMSRQLARGNREGVRSLVVDGLRVLSTVSISLMALVALAAPPLVAGLFGMGDLSPDQAALLGITVAAYSLSLPAASFQRVLLAATFARLETATYLRNTIYGAGANAIALAILVALWTWPGKLLIVPAAYSIAQLVNVWHADRANRTWLGSPIWPGREMAPSLLTIVLAAAAMALARSWTTPTLDGASSLLVIGGLTTAALGAALLWLGLYRWAPHELRRALRTL